MNHRTARLRVVATKPAPKGDDLMDLANAVQTPRPSVQGIIEHALNSDNPLAHFTAIIECQQAMTGGTITATAVRYLPLAKLLRVAGIDLHEIERADIPADVRHSFNGLIVQPCNEKPLIMVPRGQHPDHRDQAVRALVWRQLAEPVQGGHPYYLPGSKPTCLVPGCTNDHLPSAEFDGPNLTHLGEASSVYRPNGKPSVCTWYEISPGETPHVRVETFMSHDDNDRMTAAEARTFAAQLRDLAASMDASADAIDAYERGVR